MQVTHRKRIPAAWWYLVVFLCVAALLVTLAANRRDALASFFWQKYHANRAVLFLIQKDAHLAMQIGDYHFGRGAYDLARAEQFYRKALAIDPAILWGHYQLARILFIHEAYGPALEEINRELAANPENLRSLYVRGLIYGYRGAWDAAERDFRSFTKWAPKEWAGYNDLAWILSHAGKHQDAKKVIAAAFREIPVAVKNPWLWNARGVAELNLKEYPQARHSFETALLYAEKLTPGDWQRAYPGNNPAAAYSGLQTFIAATKENIRRSNVHKSP